MSEPQWLQNAPTESEPDWLKAAPTEEPDWLKNAKTEQPAQSQVPDERASLTRSAIGAAVEPIPFVGEKLSSAIRQGKESYFEPKEVSKAPGYQEDLPTLQTEFGPVDLNQVRMAREAAQEAIKESPKRLAREAIRFPANVATAALVGKTPLGKMGPLGQASAFSLIGAGSQLVQEPKPQGETPAGTVARFGKHLGEQAIMNLPFLLPSAFKGGERIPSEASSETAAQIERSLKPAPTMNAPEAVREKIDKVVADWFDKKDVIRKVEDISGTKFAPGEGPYISSRLEPGVAGKIENDLETGLRPIVAKIKDPKAFQDYAVSKYALEKQSQRDLETGLPGKEIVGKTVPELQAEVASKETPENAELLKSLVDFENKGIDAQVGTFLSKEGAENLKALNQNHVPMRRVFEPTEAKLSKGSGAIRITKLKGSEREVENILENTVSRYVTRVRASERMKGLQELANLADNSPEVQTLMRPKMVEKPQGGNIDALDTPQQSGRPAGYGEVTVYRNGEPKTYEFTQAGKELYETLVPPAPDKPSLFARIAGLGAKALRLGATQNNLDFSSRNIMMDTWDRAMQTEAGSYIGHEVFPQTVQALSDVLRNRQIYKDFIQSKASGAGMVSADRDAVKQVLRRMKPEQLYYLKHPIEGLQKLTQAVEESNRLAEYKGILGKTGSKRLAALGAKDVTVDFSRVGREGKKINDIAAFFNAGMQSISKAKRTIMANPMRTAARGFTWITVPTLAEWAMTKDRQDYQNMNNVQKTMFWNFPLTDKENGPYFVFPKPRIWGWMFGTVPREFMDYAYHRDPGHFQRMAEGLGLATLPSLIPTVLYPAAIYMANKNIWTGKDVESQVDKNLDPWLRFGPRTTELSKAVGRATEQISQKVPELGGALKVSPKRMDAMIQAIGGGGARQAAQTVGLVGRGLRKLGVLPEGYFEGEKKHQSDLRNQLPIWRSFFKEKPGILDATAIENFYKNMDDSVKAKTSVRYAAKEKILPASPRRKIMGMAGGFRNASKSISDLFRQMSQAETDDEEIKYADKINQITRRLNAAYEQRKGQKQESDPFADYPEEGGGE